MFTNPLEIALLIAIAVLLGLDAWYTRKWLKHSREELERIQRATAPRRFNMANPNTGEDTGFPLPDHIEPILTGPYKNAVEAPDDAD